MNDVVALFIFFLWYLLLFFLIHVCVVCVIFSFMFFRYGLFLSSIFRWIITTTCFCPLYSFRRIIVICVVFMMSIDVCYCREDIRYFYVILVFQGFLLKFVSLVYQKVWFRLSGSPFSPFPFCSRWFDEQNFGSKSSKSILLSVSGNVSNEGLVTNILLRPSWGEAGLASPSLAMIFLLELGPEAGFWCSRVSLTQEVRRLNLWGQSKRFPGVKVS